MACCTLTRLNEIVVSATVAEEIHIVCAMLIDGVNNEMVTRAGRPVCFSVVNPVRAVDTRTQV